MLRRLVLLCLALGSLGCNGVTEVVVIVDTDLVPGAELDGIAVSVSGDAEPSRAFGAVTSEDALPAVVGIVQSGGDLGPVTVTAQALLGVNEVVRREARFSFVEGQTRVLRLNLVASCVGVECVEGQTCTEDGCQLPFVPASQLFEYREPIGRRDAGAPRDAGQPGDAGERDAGPPVDAGPTMDAGAADGGPLDAGSTDAGSTDAAVGDAGAVGPCVGLPGTCGTGGSACVCSSCTCSPRCTGNCEVTCTSTPTCDTDARSASNVDVTCDDSTCSIDATGASNVSIVVANDAVATANCTAVSNCDMECPGTSVCLLRCSGAATCGISMCAGGATSCPGNVEVCNQACP